jgi:hypothetical protein
MTSPNLATPSRFKSLNVQRRVSIEVGSIGGMRRKLPDQCHPTWVTLKDACDR